MFYVANVMYINGLVFLTGTILASAYGKHYINRSLVFVFMISSFKYRMLHKIEYFLFLVFTFTVV